MTAQEIIDNEMYGRMCNMNYTRKAFDISEVYNTYYESLPDDIKEVINQLPISDGYKQMDSDGFFSYRLDGKQQFYVLELEDNTFALCDTQGYNYARYVTVLVGFEPNKVEEDC